MQQNSEFRVDRLCGSPDLRRVSHQIGGIACLQGFDTDTLLLQTSNLLQWNGNDVQLGRCQQTAGVGVPAESRQRQNAARSAHLCHCCSFTGWLCTSSFNTESVCIDQSTSDVFTVNINSQHPSPTFLCTPFLWWLSTFA